MGLDIRLPVGLLFLAIGALLIWFGLASDPALYQEHSLGLNINLGWGAAMAGFGALMLLLTVLHRRRG